MRKGFTLLELLVSMTIISVLLMLVLPDMAKFRKRSMDISAQNFARSIALKLEDYFVENLSYFSCTNSSCNSYIAPMQVPQDIEVKVDARESSYVIRTKHRRGTGKEFVFDSEQGGFIR
ncbi:MAG: type II secretion system GspH family protein [Deltaproteobacteria bacterium]|nr:type II secretion system GspH family protein [Deltaproteobacteria bacterium]